MSVTDVVIKRARLYSVEIPLREPFRISGGALRVRRSLVVALEDEHGRVGYGESAPFETPFYSPETVSSARDLLQTLLLPRLVGRSFHAPGVAAELASNVRGNAMARCGAETAWWDLHAAVSETSLAELVTRRLLELGVSREHATRRPHIECGVAIGIPQGHDLRALEADVERAIDRGYRRVKLKVMPGWDVAPVRRALDVVERTRAQVPLTVDANGAYSWPKDERTLRELDTLGLLYIEQPLPPHVLWDTCELAASLDTPVCLDESLTSDDVARQVIGMGGPLVWNLKIQRVGGIEEACRIYARAMRSGGRLWGGTMPETGLGAQAMLAVGCHAGFVFPSDLEPSERWYVPGSDVIELAMSDTGLMAVPERRVVPDLEGRAKLLMELEA